MNVSEINLAWARRVVADKAWLLHTPTLSIGPAEELFDGVVKVHLSEVNGKPVPSPVLRLATGHALLAEPNSFLELLPREVVFYAKAVDQMTGWVTGAVRFGAEQAIPADKTVTLLIALLRAQLRALETLAQSEAP